MIQIAFDADDTLWTNMSYYHETVDKIKEILGRYALVPKPELGNEKETSIPKEIYETETENVPVMGYGTKSFIISMVEAAIKVSRQKIRANEIQEIISLGKALMNSPVELLEHVETTLAGLSSDSALMLLTKGDLYEQERKIIRSGLSGYFRYIEIVSEKDERTYADILKKYDISPMNFLMVGNSLKSDIMPVLNIGGNAVYIPHKSSWYYEETTIPEGHNNYFKLNNISELPALIDNISA